MKKWLLYCGVIMLIGSMSRAYALTRLYETEELQRLNAGTTLTKYHRLTEKGWLAINMVAVDLENADTSLRVLTSSNGLQTFQNVKTMVNDTPNAIAAINADFFTGNYKKGNAIGMTIRDGEMLTSTYYENELKDTLASFYLDENHHAGFDFFSNQIALKNTSRGDTFLISEINKWSSNYEYPVVLTSDWGEESLGNSLGFAMTELVVSNQKVVEVRQGKEPVSIPKDGFVVCTIGERAETLQQMFHKGDKVNLSITMKMDVKKLQTAISGGTMLVENGKVADFTHVIYGSNPRTAIGLSRDKKTVYFITVDGRQNASIGVTQTELAELLIEKGIYYAMNCDGGGSTTVVARELGETDVTVENVPSEGSLRMVPNALAVMNTEKTGKLSELILEVDEVNVFVGCERNILVKGYDKYYHPVEVNLNKVKWACSGANATVKDGVLKAGKEAGSVTVTASIGKVKGTITIDILSQPYALELSPKKIAVAKGENVTFSVKGKNKNGYGASLQNEEVEWNVEGKASIRNGVFQSNQEGNFIVSATVGDVKSYALVQINSVINQTINDFEKENFYFVRYPEEVEGNIILSSQEKYEGKKSAQLEYDFTTTTKTRGAYLRFEEGISLPKGTETIRVMAYMTEATSDSIKAKITDANGKVQYLLLGKNLKEKQWQELSLSLANVALPAILTDLYVVQDHEEEMTKGSVYFDCLVLESTAVTEDSVLPSDVQGTDALQIEKEIVGEDAIQIMVAPTCSSGTLLEHLKQKRIEKIANENMDYVIQSNLNGETLSLANERKAIHSTNYTVTNDKNFTVITLDVSQGGLRASNSNQWVRIQQDISSAKSRILLVMNGSLDSFTDELEKQAWIDLLCDLQRRTGKTIWVLQSGKETGYSMQRGVKYLTLASPRLDGGTSLTDIQATQYFQIILEGNEMTYTIKNLF